MLHDLQLRFAATLRGADNAPLADYIDAPAGRIAIYRNTVQGSLVETLRAAFPVVERIVGATFFASRARDFAAAAPPRRPHLSTYGDGFADFLATLTTTSSLPYLADVARLEWALNESYFAADAPALDPATLQTLSDDHLAGLRLAMHPATRMISSSFPIVRIWQVNQLDVTDVPAIDMSIAETALVTRRDGHIAVRALASGDGAVVAALGADQVLDDAIAAAFAVDAAFDVQACLHAHLAGGTFRA